MLNELVLRRPDDWHIHLRDGAALSLTVAHAARQFGRVIAMPNLRPPVDSIEAAGMYRERILAAVPPGLALEPLMTLYLTDRVTPSVIREAVRYEWLKGIKLYPAGATTNSEAGVSGIEDFYRVFEAMEKADVPLLVHGETTARGVDVFDREKVFIDAVLVPLRERYPHLRMVLEHVSSKEGVEFVRSHAGRTAGTITVHHMCLTRNDIFSGPDGTGLHPHHFCLPVVKTEADRAAVCEAAFSGDPAFFAGTDSAPHPRQKKESACGSAGIYTAHAAIEIYAELFEGAGALDRLEAFLSLNGPRFYGLSAADGQVTLRRQAWTVPGRYALGGEDLVPFRSGEVVSWVLEGNPDRDP